MSYNTTQTLGPNVKRLIAHKVSLDAIPQDGGFAAAARFFLDTKRWVFSTKEAVAWVQMTILLLRQAAEPNPWKHATDEEIAGELLRHIEEKGAV